MAKWRVWLHSKPGMWEHYRGYVDVGGETAEDAAMTARSRLKYGSYPDRPIMSWVVEKVETCEGD